MFSLQDIIMYVFMPPAALLLLLLVIPTPQFIQRRLVAMVQAVFDLSVPGVPNIKVVLYVCADVVVDSGN